MTLCLVVIVVSLEVKHVLLQLILRIVDFLFLGENGLIASLFGSLVFVALVVAASGGAVLGPIAEAKPTEVVLAEAALHVIAPLVFFDGLAAFRAVFGVGHDPSYVLRLGRVLHVPLLCGLTVSWLVRFAAAFEAEVVPALAVDIHDPAILVDEAVIAPGERAPPYLFVVISVALAVPFLIGLEVFALEEVEKGAVRHCHVTHVLRASGRYTVLETLIDSARKVIIPILCAELVAALETVRLRARLVEFGVAYLTVALVISLKSGAGEWVLFSNREVKLKTDLFRKLARVVGEKLLLESLQVPLEVPEKQDCVVVRHAHGLPRIIDYVGHYRFYVGKLEDLEATLWNC